MSTKPTWASDDTQGAACEALPFDVAAALFTASSDGGSMGRTRAFPSKDTHAEARAVCSRCPLLEPCLLQAMRCDPWTFRGGLSPEERAAFGGYRDPYVARRRSVYLTRPRVWSRVLLSPLPVERLRRALTTWRDYLVDGDEQALGIGDFTGIGGPSGRTTPHTAAQDDPDVFADWFVEYTPPEKATTRTPDRAPSGPVQQALPLW